MFGGVGKPAGWATILVASGVVLASSLTANAADLGGDCCADLEERIAELEATTARKGNRKVSLEVSGHVNEAVMWWDDGGESNTYVVGNDSGRSRFRFKGKAKINSDWSAGYLIEIGLRTARSDRVDQGPPPDIADVVGDDPAATFDIRHSVWNLTSKSYGSVYMGFSNSANESITEANITQTKDIAKNSDTEDQASGFQLRNSLTGGVSAIEWRRLVKDDFVQPGEGSRGTYVRYVSPEFKGFWVEASYGEDDQVDASVNWKGHEHGFKWLAGFGYGENTDTTEPTMPCIVSPANGDAECHQYGGSFSVLHEDSGLFANFGAGQFVDERIDGAGFVAGFNPDDEHTFYSIQAGIEKKWIDLGKTTLYGEYFDHDGGANDRSIAVGDAINPFANTARIANSEVQTYGVGVIQGIDAAAMRLYAFWRHYEADLTVLNNTTGATAEVPLDDLDVVMGGALIQF